MADFSMPILGADMTEGTVVAWRKRPGEHVERGEIIVEVETDKATVEVESFLAGTVETILVDEGLKVPVGTPLAVIRAEGEQPVAPRPVPPVRGTGRDGRITQEKMEQAAKGPARPTEEAPDRQTRMRQAIATAMSRS